MNIISYWTSIYYLSISVKPELASSRANLIQIFFFLKEVSKNNFFSKKWPIRRFNMDPHPREREVFRLKKKRKQNSQTDRYLCHQRKELGANKSQKFRIFFYFLSPLYDYKRAFKQSPFLNLHLQDIYLNLIAVIAAILTLWIDTKRLCL